jgi:hypothetical protein
VGATHTLLPDYTEDEDADDNDMTEESQRCHLIIGDIMDVEEHGAVGGPLLDAEPFKEGQNLSPDASNESVSEKARVFILKNRKKTAVDDRLSGNKNTHDGEISAVAPPRPPVPNAMPPLSPTASDVGKKILLQIRLPLSVFHYQSCASSKPKDNNTRWGPGILEVGWGLGQAGQRLPGGG